MEQWRLTGNLWADLTRSLCRLHLIGLWSGLVHRTMRSGKHKPKTLFRHDVKMLLRVMSGNHGWWLIDLSNNRNSHSGMSKLLLPHFNQGAGLSGYIRRVVHGGWLTRTVWVSWFLIRWRHCLFTASPCLLRCLSASWLGCQVSPELSGQCDTLMLRGLRVLLRVQHYRASTRHGQGYGLAAVNSYVSVYVYV